MNKKILSAIIVSIGVIALFSYLFLAQQNKALPQTTVSDYKNTTYIVDGQKVKLTAGTHEETEIPGSASKVLTAIFGNEKVGDINGDKRDDIVFLLVRSGSGSGTFYYVTSALQNEDGSYAGTNALFLGDRISPQTTEIQNGIITINYAERKMNEPMTTPPSVGKSMFISLENGTLIEKK